jgi:hypothetical protein
MSIAPSTAPPTAPSEATDVAIERWGSPRRSLIVMGLLTYL